MAITFLFCLLAGRFFYVQVVWSGQLGYRALDQWMREIPVVAERGIITDRNGVVLAENDTSYTVFARSNAVKDKEGTAKLLADCLDVDGEKLLDKLESVKASEITVARHVDKSDRDARGSWSRRRLLFPRQYAGLSQRRRALSGARIYVHR